MTIAPTAALILGLLVGPLAGCKANPASPPAQAGAFSEQDMPDGPCKTLALRWCRDKHPSPDLDPAAWSGCLEEHFSRCEAER